MKINKVLVINEGYSDNLGDQAINDSLQYLLKSSGIENIDFQDFTKNIDKPIEISTESNTVNKSPLMIQFLKKIIPSKVRWILKNIKRIIKISKNKYDLIIIGGGQLIMSNSTFPIALYCWINCLNYFGNNKIVLFGVGVASDIRFKLLDKVLLKNVLKKIKDIYVRDEKSKILLSNIFGIKSNFVYDVAFMHNHVVGSLNIKKDGTLLGVMPYKSYLEHNKNKISEEEYFDTWIDLLYESNVNIKDVKLFYTTQSDRIASLAFKEYVKKKLNISLDIIETNTKEKLIDELNKSKLVISARMHALILGMLYNCKIIVYPISEKLKEFDKLYNNKNFNILNIQNEIRTKFLQCIKGVTQNDKL